MPSSHPPSADFPSELIALHSTATTKAAAIDAAADLLVQAGAIDPAYAASMHAREAHANTYLGQGVAIPHGQQQERHLVLQDRIAVVQLAQGVDWGNGDTVRLIFGIAAKGDGHLDVLRRITRLLQDKALLERLCTTTDKNDIARALSSADTPQHATPEPAVVDLAEQQSWVVDYPNGLHARPASAWLHAARDQAQQDSQFQVRNTRNGLSSTFVSLVDLLHIDARCGDTLVFSAQGAQAQQHLQQVLAQVKALSQEEKAIASAASVNLAAAKDQAASTWRSPEGKEVLHGVSASPGLCIGTVQRIHSGAVDIADTPEPLAQAGQRLQSAIDAAQAQLAALIDEVGRRVGASDGAIFKSHTELLRDEVLLATVAQYLCQGHGLAWSWQRAYTEVSTQMQAQGNPVLASRAADICDVGQRVLSHIAPEYALGEVASVLAHLPEDRQDVVLVADDLSPSDTANLDTSRVRALVTALGGPYAHTAILARTLGLPAIVAVGDTLHQVQDGQKVIVDGSSGILWLAPEEDDIQAAQTQIQAMQLQCEQQMQQRQLPATTQDGRTTAIAANINHPEQAAMAIDCGAEGVGLMRTEFLFLERGSSPTEDEQYATYCAMFDALQGRPLIVRTLDIGGDKQAAYLNLPHEDNPFLGVRGARLLLRRPDLLQPQLRALYRTAKDRCKDDKAQNLWIMFPMITTVEEVAQIKRLAEAIRLELDAPSVPLGIMIEVPAAALLAHKFAAHVDFFSIGTNDLTQYTLAMDRQNPVLAAQADSLHPAVLRMIDATVQGARQHGRWVGVCGGLAGDAFGAGLLVGLGVQELSMTSQQIPEVKDWLRAHHVEHLQALARKALTLETAVQVRALKEECA